MEFENGGNKKSDFGCSELRNMRLSHQWTALSICAPGFGKSQPALESDGSGKSFRNSDNHETQEISALILSTEWGLLGTGERRRLHPVCASAPLKIFYGIALQNPPVG
ncbi:MAG TPA: hypothetical protein VFM25_00955 [Verrucomicrobiae bacterium]|nr:hypothetical protein [Verrucomicrobiae bacterium]